MAQVNPTVGSDSYFDRKEKLFYSANPLNFIGDFITIFHQVIFTAQVFNKVVQGTPIPQHRVLFFIERLPNRTTAQKWPLFFKHLLRHYTLHEIGDLLYQGFYNAGLQQYYLDLATKDGNYYLWPQGKYIVNPNCELPGPLQWATEFPLQGSQWMNNISIL